MVYTVLNSSIKDIVDMVMKVTRNGHSYDVHIKIEHVGNDWKILSADGI